MPNPRLSIVIPTYNRRALLLKLLDAIDALRADPGELEVVVVDDGSQDGTLAALEHRAGVHPLRVVRQDAQGPAAARNRGAAEARGEILGFLDSDVLAHPDWWLSAKPHFSDPRVAAVEGATLPPPGSGTPTPFTNFVHNACGRSYQTCNLLCRREVFLAAGGFDERFRIRLPGGRILHNREDSDLAFAILERGERIVFEPQALVWHPLTPPFTGLHFLKARHALLEALLRRKHPKLYRRELKWVDGRAVPVFYWGLYLGVPLALTGWGTGLAAVAWLGGLSAGLGWAGALYALVRKRRVSTGDALLLGAQMLVLPWLRLYWLARGEWRFRHIRPATPGGAGDA